MRHLRLLPLAVIFALTVGLAGRAEATQVGYGKRFGVGAMLGDPTGLTLKWFVSQSNALDLGLGFGGYGWRNRCWEDEYGYDHCDYGYGGMSLNIDYLWQSSIVKSTVQLDWHVGVGGRMWFYNYDHDYYDEDIDLAVRAPIGLDMMFRNPDFLEIFFEIAPSLALLHPSLFFDVAVGARFFF